MKRTPMKRTAFSRAASTTAKSEPNRALALEERAQRAINSAAATAAMKSEQNQRLALDGKALSATNCVATERTVCTPMPKEAEATKPGKRKPTKAERAWMDAIVEHGCICCVLDGHAPRPTAVHHVLRGGQRIGHLHTIPLCDPGHHQGGQPLGLESRHPNKARFEEKYGTEQELLAIMKTRIFIKV